MPPQKGKPSEEDEELMKGFHGIIKAMNKMVGMKKELKPKFAEAKAAMKEAFADILKGDPSTLDDDDSSSSTAPPEPPPAGAPPPPDPGAGAPPPTTAS